MLRQIVRKLEKSGARTRCSGASVNGDVRERGKSQSRRTKSSIVARGLATVAANVSEEAAIGAGYWSRRGVGLSKSGAGDGRRTWCSNVRRGGWSTWIGVVVWDLVMGEEALCVREINGIFVVTEKELVGKMGNEGAVAGTVSVLDA